MKSPFAMSVSILHRVLNELIQVFYEIANVSVENEILIFQGEMMMPNESDQPKPNAAPEQEWIDPDDAPELTEEFFERGEIWHGDKLIRPGNPMPGRSQKTVSEF